MTLPSPTGGSTTEQVGFFEVGAPDLAAWIVGGFDPGWTIRSAGLVSMGDAVAFLAPGVEVTRYLLRHAISINHSYYGDAVQWGEAWLVSNGF